MKRYISPDGPFPCHFGCGNWLRTKFSREAIEGWDWFTGYGSATVHFCPRCRQLSIHEIERIKANLNKRPENYPRERAEP